MKCCDQEMSVVFQSALNSIWKCNICGNAVTDFFGAKADVDKFLAKADAQVTKEVKTAETEVPSNIETLKEKIHELEVAVESAIA